MRDFPFIQILLVLLFHALGAHAQEAQDTTAMETSHASATTFPHDTIALNTKVESLFSNRLVQTTYIGVPLVVAALLESRQDRHFRSLRNGFMESFKNPTDNYLQFAPAVAMVAMKSLGVESQSSWEKMLTADAFSVGLLVAATRGMKEAINVERPDGTAKNSFPSGHTATAFMCATMLHHEYGSLSPWISCAGYSVATATGVMRIMNNRHWMSDVLAGAGIGILATEFGYWLADLCFPKQPKSYDPKSVVLLDDGKTPSFVGLFAGFFIPLTRNIGDNLRREASTGGTFGLEGAWFFNQHFGIGGRLSVSNVSCILDGDKRTEDGPHFYSTMAGVHFSHHVWQRMYVGAKMLCGYTFYPNPNRDILTHPRKDGVSYLGGLSLGIRAKQHLDFKAGVDYELMPSPSAETSRMQALIFTGAGCLRF